MLCSDLVELSEFGQGKLLILFVRARILVHLGTIVETRRSNVDTIALLAIIGLGPKVSEGVGSKANIRNLATSPPQEPCTSVSRPNKKESLTAKHRFE